MTLRIIVKNDERGGTPHNARVHRVYFNDDGIHAEDGVIIKPGEEASFVIWGNHVRLAIEEEYTPKVEFVDEAQSDAQVLGKALSPREK